MLWFWDTLGTTWNRGISECGIYSDWNSTTLPLGHWQIHNTMVISIDEVQMAIETAAYVVCLKYMKLH